MPHLLQQLLEISAKQYPDKAAVIYKNSAITYRELDAVSSHLAWVLNHADIKKGDRIGIYLNKSIEAVAAIFGILKVGAVYVPLDPSAPIRRVVSIINDCGIEILVTTQKKLANLQQVLPNLSPIQCAVLVDGEQFQVSRTLSNLVSWQDVLQAPLFSPLSTEVTDSQLAYILYTSGSTGIPKGVTISHRAALNFVNWSWECFQVSYSDRVSNHAPLHFDLSIFDIFTTIKAGATVIIVPEVLTVFPLELANFIAEQQITIWYSVPSVLIQLVLHGNLPRHQFSCFRAILFAGEVFPIKYLRQLMECVPQSKYYNLYGPTETNVCTYYEVEKIPDEIAKNLPIGKVCANNELFAVNDQGEIVVDGEVGELYVQGASLMNGYWGQTELTKSVLLSYQLTMFSALTMAEKNEGLAYRTGDLVKLGPDGNYLFIGRRDKMIKSRGYRIDLGEIETTLYRHPQVAEVAVVAIPDAQIGNIIKSVVVPRDRKSLEKCDLVSFCAAILPKYMIPSEIEIRASLPKTSTGKVDSKLL